MVDSSVSTSFRFLPNRQARKTIHFTERSGIFTNFRSVYTHAFWRIRLSIFSSGLLNFDTSGESSKPFCLEVYFGNDTHSVYFKRAPFTLSYAANATILPHLFTEPNREGNSSGVSSVLLYLEAEGAMYGVKFVKVEHSFPGDIILT